MREPPCAICRAPAECRCWLYYYFESKERLLFLIQKHTFTTVVRRLKERLDGVSDPEQQVRIFILNHLEYFLANPAAMKVLSHEAEALKNGFLRKWRPSNASITASAWAAG